MNLLALLIMISVCSNVKSASFLKQLKYIAKPEPEQTQEAPSSSVYNVMETPQSNNYEKQPPTFHPAYNDNYQQEPQKPDSNNYEPSLYQQDMKIKFKPADSPPLYPISLFEKEKQQTNYHSNEQVMPPTNDQEPNYQPNQSHNSYTDSLKPQPSSQVSDEPSPLPYNKPNYNGNDSNGKQNGHQIPNQMNNHYNNQEPSTYNKQINKNDNNSNGNPNGQMATYYDNNTQYSNQDPSNKPITNNDNSNPNKQMQDQMTTYYEKSSQYDHENPTTSNSQGQNQVHNQKSYKEPSYSHQSTNNVASPNLERVDHQNKQIYAQNDDSNKKIEKSSYGYAALQLLAKIQRLIEEFKKHIY